MHTFSPLPLGGAVLLDTETLAICECDEYEGDLIALALAGGDDDPEVRRMTATLQDSGWRLGIPDRR